MFVLALKAIEDRHAGDGRLGVVVGGRVDHILGAEHQHPVGLAKLGVDVVHLEHLVVGHLGFGQQHVHMAGHAADHRVFETMASFWQSDR